MFSLEKFTYLLYHRVTQLSSQSRILEDERTTDALRRWKESVKAVQLKARGWELELRQLHYEVKGSVFRRGHGWTGCKDPVD